MIVGVFGLNLCLFLLERGENGLSGCCTDGVPAWMTFLKLWILLC